MWKWQPDRTELPYAGFEIIEQSTGFIDVRDCVDVNKRAVVCKQIEECINDDDGGKDTDQQPGLPEFVHLLILTSKFARVGSICPPFVDRL
jgi:hypothetical protein